VSLRSRFFAATYDPMMKGPEKAGLREHRRALIGRASGRVLEIGAGTGANLPFYGDGVVEIVATEPEEAMAKRLERKLPSFTRPVSVVRAPAEKLPVEDASFDFAVCTLALCTVRDQPQALAELHRALKPGGQLLFLEHVRSTEPRLARWQDRLNGFQRCIAQGCNCNRDTLAAISSAGFTLGDVTHDRLRKAPPTVRPLVVGVATRS
jgi:ubiquinone/menaquinone biosynthesis C-methylase UbiE